MKHRYLFASMGSYGDLHPMLGVALELKRRGHFVQVAAVDVYREKLEKAGVEYIELAPTLEELGPEREWFSQAMHPFFGARFVLRDIGFGYIRENYRRLEKPAAQADLLVGQAVTFFVPVLAEKLKKPWASFILQPALFLSRHDPPALAGLGWLAKLVAKSEFVYRAFVFILRIGVEPWSRPWRELRRELGLPEGAPHPLFEGHFSPQLTFAMFSPLFAPRQADWPTLVEQTGFAIYDQDKSAELSPELEAFLAAGPAPLVFTLGTAAVMDALDFYRVAAEAASRLGQRAVLLVGRDERNREGLPKDRTDLFVSEYEPYSKLFPRAAAIMHQGGAGTTAQALRSGRPQVIHPFSHDQPDNAAHAARLGVSITLPKRKRSGAAFTKALREVLENESYVRQALAVSQAMQNEDGIKAVADRLERFLDR